MKPSQPPTKPSLVRSAAQSEFVGLLRAESTINPQRMMMAATILGLSNLGVLAIVNQAAALVSEKENVTGLFFAFIAVTIVFLVLKRYVSVTTIRETEQIIHRLRLRVIDKVMKSDLASVDEIGRHELLAIVGKDTQVLSQAAFMLGNGIEAVALLVFTVIYLIFLSSTAFLIGAVVIGLSVIIYFSRITQINQRLGQALAAENETLVTVADVLYGFKEAKLNRARREDLLWHLARQSSDATQSKVGTLKQLSEYFTLTQVMFYLLIAVMVFAVPIFSDSFSSVVIKASTSVLFVVSSVTTIISSIPLLAQANAAAVHIRAVERTLDGTVHPEAQATGDVFGAFDLLETKGLSYHYSSGTPNQAFAVGPVNLQLKAGETVFISGGNGSGKSTFMRLLVGLYLPASGAVEVNGQRVTPACMNAYRNLFSVVFTDFHLFRRLFGLMKSDPRRIEECLDLFEMRDKVKVVNGEFSTIDLSTGQKKRLALMVALLEDKPVLVLDEWAADQDPQFRHKFYAELLPAFKRAGKTVLAITHDDKYFHVADRHWVMDYGKLRELEKYEPTY